MIVEVCILVSYRKNSGGSDDDFKSQDDFKNEEDSESCKEDLDGGSGNETREDSEEEEREDSEEEGREDSEEEWREDSEAQDDLCERRFGGIAKTSRENYIKVDAHIEL